MIVCTYEHLAAGADKHERELLDAFARRAEVNGRYLGAESEEISGR
jgi:hypothetical protein